jgi:hypothetical protein
VSDKARARMGAYWGIDTDPAKVNAPGALPCDSATVHKGYTTRQMILDGGYELASLASRFAGRDTNELASIRSTVDTQTRWLLSKRPLRPCAL